MKGEEIPLAARIFAVADVWDAMISERVYRAALPQQEVLSYLVENRGAHFDPQVVDAFIEMVSSK